MFRHSTLTLSRASCRVPRVGLGLVRSDVAAASRRSIQGPGGFSPLRPPSPEELGAPRAAKQYKKGRRWTRWLVVGLAAGGTIYVADRQIYASGFARTLRTFTTTLLVALDYKVNFRPEPLDGRVLCRSCTLAMRSGCLTCSAPTAGCTSRSARRLPCQSAVLPPEFQKMFGRMFDDAPQDDWRDVEAVIRRDFGKSVEDVFGVSFTGKEGMGCHGAQGEGECQCCPGPLGETAGWARGGHQDSEAGDCQADCLDLWAFRYAV
ncbi:hypothetical protein J3459_011456 [Metarhizium acridum]|nr:hypothetical protein J3459_011456 [Metarhizium acridum]